MSSGFKDIHRIARATTWPGRSGKASFPVPALIAISHGLTVDSYNSDESSRSKRNPLALNFDLEMSPWSSTLVSSKYFITSSVCGVPGIQKRRRFRPRAGRQSRPQS